MATVRDGDRAVLLVVDVQAGVVKGAWESARVVGNVARAVERARAAGVPVVWVQHHDEELVRDSLAWQWAKGLDPAADEARVHKAHNSAFEETDLDALLERHGASHVVLAGCATNWCIRATAYGALERGYDLTLLSDAHTTSAEAAAALVDDLNDVMTWLSYPGRRNTTATVEAFAFGTRRTTQETQA